jgi:hypothetical protein
MLEAGASGEKKCEGIMQELKDKLEDLRARIATTMVHL